MKKCSSAVDQVLHLDLAKFVCHNIDIVLLSKYCSIEMSFQCKYLLAGRYSDVLPIATCVHVWSSADADLRDGDLIMLDILTWLVVR